MKKALFISALLVTMISTAFAGLDIELGQNYPNPASGKTYIEVAFDSPTASLRVYNVLGKLIVEKTLSNAGTFVIDVTDYPEGVYLYTLEADGEKITKRMTVKK